MQEEKNRSFEVYQAMEPGVYAGKELSERLDGQIIGRERRLITMSRCMKLFSRRLILDNMKYCDPSIRMGEDVNITLPALLDAERVVIMKGAAWYHYLYLTDSMAHAYDDGLFENILRLYVVMETILREKKAPDAVLQAQRELILLMLLEVKNQARGNRKGWKERLRQECGHETVKRALSETAVTAVSYTHLDVYKRQGYNSAYLAYAAMFSMKWLLGQSLHGTTGFFQAFLVIWALYGLKSFQSHKSHLADGCRAAILLYAIVVSERIMSPATDFGAMYLVFWIVCLWTKTACEREAGKEEKTELYAVSYTHLNV